VKPKTPAVIASFHSSPQFGQRMEEGEAEDRRSAHSGQQQVPSGEGDGSMVHRHQRSVSNGEEPG
jgi:hypothetical protein